MLGQPAIGTKSNEIVTIPLLLERLHLTGALITIDAIGCQTKIAQTILAACRIEGTQIHQDWLELGMSNFIPFNRDQSFLLPPDLTAWLPADDVAHFIVAAR